jgi:hypothetical protein
MKMAQRGVHTSGHEVYKTRRNGNVISRRWAIRNARVNSA